MASQPSLPVNMIHCFTAPLQADLHLDHTDLPEAAPIISTSPDLNTENGCLSQPSEHHHNLPARAGHHHLQASALKMILSNIIFPSVFSICLEMTSILSWSLSTIV